MDARGHSGPPLVVQMTIPNVDSLCCFTASIDPRDERDPSARSDFHWQIFKCRLVGVSAIVQYRLDCGGEIERIKMKINTTARFEFVIDADALPYSDASCIVVFSPSFSFLFVFECLSDMQNPCKKQLLRHLGLCLTVWKVSRAWSVSSVSGVLLEDNYYQRNIPTQYSTRHLGLSPI